MRKITTPTIISVVILLLIATLISVITIPSSPTTTTPTTVKPLTAPGKFYGAGSAACVVPVGKGAPGVCGPVSIKNPFFTLSPPGPQIIDVSNNDPIYNWTAEKRAGIVAVWAKVNEGTGFIDSTYSNIVAGARRSRLAVGGYDFVRTYSISEANVFVARLRATGTCAGRNVLPPILDVEVNAAEASERGLQNMVNTIRSACGRVGIYTGPWFFNPTFGSWLPYGVSTYWISGYPTISGWSHTVTVHQWTDDGFFSTDQSVVLSSYAQLANTNIVKPPVKPVSKSVQIARLKVAQAGIRHDLTVHKCRTVHGKRAYKYCPRIAKAGQRVDRELHALGSK